MSKIVDDFANVGPTYNQFILSKIKQYQQHFSNAQAKRYDRQYSRSKHYKNHLRKTRNKNVDAYYPTNEQYI
jgi:hypothetical protein